MQRLYCERFKVADVTSLHGDATLAKGRLSYEAVDKDALAVATLLLCRLQHLSHLSLVRSVKFVTLTSESLCYKFVVTKLKAANVKFYVR